MRVALAALAVVILAVAGFVFWPQRVETYRDKYVIAGEIRRPIKAVFVHFSNPTYLVVDGKNYEHPRGARPYYLEVPELDSILFVTEDRKGKGTIHLLNLKNKKETIILLLTI